MAIGTEFELRDPLKAIMDRIRHSPDTVEHRLLLRVVRALSEPEAEEDFNCGDVAALSLSVSQLLFALVDDLTSGRYRRDDLQSTLLIYKISSYSGVAK